MARIDPIPSERMTAEQRHAIEAMAPTRSHNEMRGPHSVWMHTPEVLDLVAPMLTYLRNKTPLPLRLSALAILTTARAWSAQYAWWAHEKRALKGGLDPAIVDAIKHRRTPVFAKDDEAIVYDLTTELLETRAVGDATYARALGILGEKNLMYLVNLVGCYLMVAATLVTFKVDVPDGSLPLSSSV